MAQQVPLLFVALVANLLVMIGLTIWAWHRRQFAGVKSYWWFSLNVTAWGGASTIAVITDSDPWAAFWYNDVRMVAVALIPVTLVGFVFEYTGQRLSTERVLWLLVVPTFTTLLNWFAPRAVLYDFSFEQHNGFRFHASNAYGPWFWVHMTYSYMLVGVAVYELVRFARDTVYPYRQQALAFLAGLGLALITNLLNTLAYLTRPLHDFSVLTFSATAMIWAWALYRYHLLQVMPVARAVVLESMDDAMLVLDSAGRLVDMNPAAREFLPTPNTALGQLLRDVFPELYLDRQTDSRAEVDLNVAGKARTYDLRISDVALRGERSGRLIVLRDVTDRKRAEKEREALIRELDAYAHTVAHDLKNPLNTVLGFTYLLLQDAVAMSMEELQQYLGQIERGAQRMNRIVNELLLLATVRNQDEVETGPLDMDAIVNEVIARFQYSLDESGAILRLPDEWPAASGHAPWVEEIWANYISNALKYGGQPPLIEMGADHPTPGMVRFWVRDNGDGVPAEQLDTLFIEFTRLKGVRAKGHGLGLSIVRRIAERLGGEVGVELAPDGGSRFYFTLPAATTGEHT